LTQMEKYGKNNNYNSLAKRTTSILACGRRSPANPENKTKKRKNLIIPFLPNRFNVRSFPVSHVHFFVVGQMQLDGVAPPTQTLG